MLHKWIEYLWYPEPKKKLYLFWVALLMPLEYLFKLVVSLRYASYKKNYLKRKKFKTPVIVVGNVTVGGTGKTPLTIELVKKIGAQGLKVAVVTRGYNSRVHRFPYVVTNKASSRLVGDEAVLIRKHTQVPVVIDPNRVRGVSYIEKKIKPDLIISDDGFQHYAMSRAIEILVIDSNRAFGNGHMLPAGPLRESIHRIKRCDFVVINGEENTQLLKQLEPYVEQNNIVQMELKKGELVSLDDIAIFAKTNIYRDYSNVMPPKSGKVHAVAGIGNPKRFFNDLRKLGFSPIEHSFPDHHRYHGGQLKFSEAYPIVMTEKDAVKCVYFNIKNCWYLPVVAKLNNNLSQAILDKLGMNHVAMTVKDEVMLNNNII